MKRLWIATLVLLTLPLLAGLAWAAEAPAQAGDVVVPAAAPQAGVPAEAALCDSQKSSLGGLDALFGEQAVASCGCRDLCKTDSQCVFFYGPGSVCLPSGPCGCKQCSATS